MGAILERRRRKFCGFFTLHRHLDGDFRSAAGENFGILSLYTGIFKGDFIKKIWTFWDPSCPPPRFEVRSARRGGTAGLIFADSEMVANFASPILAEWQNVTSPLGVAGEISVSTHPDEVAGRRSNPSGHVAVR